MAETAPPAAAAATSTPNNGTGTGAGTATGTGAGTTGGAANTPNTAAQGASSTSGPSNTADQNGTNRGLPYYEKLRRDLRDTLQKKRLMDKSMVSCLAPMNMHKSQIELT